jgi:hypothetical protein
MEFIFSVQRSRATALHYGCLVEWVSVISIHSTILCGAPDFQATYLTTQLCRLPEIDHREMHKTSECQTIRSACNKLIFPILTISPCCLFNDAV